MVYQALFTHILNKICVGSFILFGFVGRFLYEQHRETKLISLEINSEVLYG